MPADKSELSAEGVGIRSTTASFSFFCPDPRCHRHESIPVQVIDEPLYEAPPTLLLGTLDKFAMLAWRPEASAFFGARAAGAPPSLIVQDELHLITGPLGTVSGVYEAAIDAVITKFGGRTKRLCATATIRRVAEQARALYARPVSVFPPPGIDAADAFFSRADTSSGLGRLYVGAMAQGHTPTFSTVMAAAAMLQTVADISLTPGERDSWWTLVAYHNSKRELGKTLTLARDDIPARLKSLAAPDPAIPGGSPGRREREIQRVSELSANVKGPDIPKVLDELKRSLETGGAVDVLCCTNMLSVGVDVGRLGMMLVVGQPKTTSEYIQATSRVGAPGTDCRVSSSRSTCRPSRGTDRTTRRSRAITPRSTGTSSPPASRRTRCPRAPARCTPRSSQAVRNSIESLGANASAQNFDPGETETRSIARRHCCSGCWRPTRTRRSGIEADFEAFVRSWQDATHGNLRYATARGAPELHAAHQTVRRGPCTGGTPDAAVDAQRRRRDPREPAGATEREEQCVTGRSGALRSSVRVASAPSSTWATRASPSAT